MVESIGSLVHVLLTTLGLAAPDPSAAALVAVAITALAVVALALQSLVLPISALAASARPRRARHLVVALSQSDPDAPGHARPRAPGLVAPAA